MSPKEAAAHFGRSEPRVYSICREEGLTFGTDGQYGRSRALRALREKIAGAASKATKSELMAMFGATRAQVARACALHGVRVPRADNALRRSSLAERRRLRPRADKLFAGIPEAARWAAEQLLLTDRTMTDIAGQWGLTRQRVHQVWRTLLRIDSGEPIQANKVRAVSSKKAAVTRFERRRAAQPQRAERVQKRKLARLTTQKRRIQRQLAETEAKLDQPRLPTRRWRVGVQYRNDRPLVEVLAEVLKDRWMTPAEAADAAQNAGYRSIAVNFVAVVTAGLKGNGRFERSEGGRYRAK